MMVSYEEAKERVGRLIGKGKPQLLCASAISGVFTALFSLPFDNMKTRLQKMKANPDGTLPYSGLLDCFKKTFGREGIRGLYAGLPTYYFRMAPHAMIVSPPLYAGTPDVRVLEEKNWSHEMSVLKILSLLFKYSHRASCGDPS